MSDVLEYLKEQSIALTDKMNVLLQEKSTIDDKIALVEVELNHVNELIEMLHLDSVPGE